MSILNISRGGTPDFKGYLCEGQYAEFTPPYSQPPIPGAPPFNSHADGAYGQGYLNLMFPLVPNLNNSDAHQWMQTALRRGVKTKGDVIILNWVPHRSYLESMYWEVTLTDAVLDGVYVMPVSYRSVWNFTTHDWDWVQNTDFDDELGIAGVTQMPLGTPAANDKLYNLALLSRDPAKVPSTFGHDIMMRDDKGKPTGPYDAYFGTVCTGLQIVDGSDEAIAEMWRANFALHVTAKLLAFESASQTG